MSWLDELDQTFRQLAAVLVSLCALLDLTSTGFGLAWLSWEHEGPRLLVWGLRGLALTLATAALLRDRGVVAGLVGGLALGAWLQAASTARVLDVQDDRLVLGWLALALLAAAVLTSGLRALRTRRAPS